VLRLLEGKNVNLRLVEKEDLPLLAEWIDNPAFFGEYNYLTQMSQTDLEKARENAFKNIELADFLIETKDGSKIGYIQHFTHPAVKRLEIGFSMNPSERGKGYCTEAVRIMIDYLFLSKDLIRIQAQTETGNLASQKVLEKAGFDKEGTMRKCDFSRGEWKDAYLYSILREEWKEPKVLTKTA
jgi:RimJ/RimL family protein N-acetyltransferase